MQKAKLIKRNERPKTNRDQANNKQQAQEGSIRNAVKTVQVWVKEFQIGENNNARKQFAALFENTVTA